MTQLSKAEPGKVAIVTGSALNIGRAIALHLARDGFRILVRRGSRRTIRTKRHGWCATLGLMQRFTWPTLRTRRGRRA